MSTRNKYKAWCSICNKRVQVGDGLVDWVHGRFITRHDKCMKSVSESKLNKALMPRQSEIDDTCKYESPQLSLRF